MSERLSDWVIQCVSVRVRPNILLLSTGDVTLFPLWSVVFTAKYTDIDAEELFDETELSAKAGVLLQLVNSTLGLVGVWEFVMLDFFVYRASSMYRSFLVF
jgi:hypothetical protein